MSELEMIIKQRRDPENSSIGFLDLRFHQNMNNGHFSDFDKNASGNVLTISPKDLDNYPIDLIFQIEIYRQNSLGKEGALLGITEFYVYEHRMRYGEADIIIKPYEPPKKDDEEEEEEEEEVMIKKFNKSCLTIPNETMKEYWSGQHITLKIFTTGAVVDR